jgi:mycothiol synthase
VADVSFPPNLTAAPADFGELDELTKFVQRVCLAESGRKLYTRDELNTYFGMPEFDIQRDTLILRDTTGAMVGAEWVENNAPFVRPGATGFVAPEKAGTGIGTAMLGWARGVAESRVGEAPEGARVILAAGVDARHEPSLELMRGTGMEFIRYFLEMRIDFDVHMPEPRFPEGVEVRTFQPGEDDAIAYRAIDEAFKDHFGHVDRPFELGLRRFRHRMNSETFDPSLWWLAFEGAEVIGANLCDPSVEDDERIGYVGSLSVRKPWRGQGVAKAFLVLAFQEFHRRAKTAATLHVDAENLTGATRLYEAVGMRESERYALFEIELRPGEDLSVR